MLADPTGNGTSSLCERHLTQSPGPPRTAVENPWETTLDEFVKAFVPMFLLMLIPVWIPLLVVVSGAVSDLFARRRGELRVLGAAHPVRAAEQTPLSEAA